MWTLKCFEAGWCLLWAALHLVWFHPIRVCLWVFKHNAICWRLLWAGWACYIFTVSVMINVSSSPHSLKQRSFTSPPLLRDRLLSPLSDFSPLFKAQTLTVCFYPLFVRLALPHMFNWSFSDFSHRINDWIEPHLLGEYDFFICSVWKWVLKECWCFMSSYVSHFTLNL